MAAPLFAERARRHWSIAAPRAGDQCASVFRCRTPRPHLNGDGATSSNGAVGAMPCVSTPCEEHVAGAVRHPGDAEASRSCLADCPVRLATVWMAPTTEADTVKDRACESTDRLRALGSARCLGSGDQSVRIFVVTSRTATLSRASGGCCARTPVRSRRRCSATALTTACGAHRWSMPPRQGDGAVIAPGLRGVGRVGIEPTTQGL
jgi:hypothetical protein